MPRKLPSRIRQRPAAPKLRIGAVSLLTKIPVDTLRAWERRYGVVAPDRADSAVRLYSQEHVARLERIKRLVDHGHAIGSIANLSRGALDAMLARHEAPARPPAMHATIDLVRVMAYSDGGPPLDAAQAEADGVTVLGQHATWAAFEADVIERAPQVIVVQMAALVPERVDEILRLVWRSAVVRTIVAYGFAPGALVERLEAEGVIAWRSPLSHAQLLRELRRPGAPAVDAPRAPRSDPAPRVFSEAALVELANLATSVSCECPHHLVDIIRMLTQFEDYSSQCENRNDADAALHSALRATTGRARALMERALIDVAADEGIALPAGIQVQRASESDSGTDSNRAPVRRKRPTP